MNLRRFEAYYADLKAVRGTLVLAVLAGMVASWSSGFGIPFMLDKVIPVVFNEKPMPEFILQFLQQLGVSSNVDTWALVCACLFLPFSFVLRGVGSFYNVYLLSKAGFKILERIRLRVFAKLQFVPLAFHESQKRGDLLARVLNDTASLQAALTQVANDMLIQPLTLLGALGFLLYKSVTSNESLFLLVNLVSVGLMVIPIWWLGKKMLKRARALQGQAGNISAIIQENLAAQRDIRAYQLEHMQIKLLRSNIELLLKLNLKVVKCRQLLSPAVEIVTALGLAFALYQGRSKGMEFSSFVALATALFMAYEPIKKLGMVHNRLRQAEASLERLEHILLAEVDFEAPAEASAQSTPRLQGSIEFKHANFGYNPEHLILRDLNVQISAGEVVALVGSSGAGKTSFASLLPRFYELGSGELLIDNKPLVDYGVEQLRANIALVTQHPILFRDTVRNNIRVGRPQASDAEVEQAARMAAAHDFIMALPQGYDTMLAEGGEGVSGGQRQRIAIARAFLKDAPILILDEATAALDAQSEALIQQELAQLVRGRTTLIIAHRFSTIQIADRILVFEQGRISGDGVHADLYATHALYQEFCRKQGISAEQGSAS